jgi:hypothetical protein
MLLVTLDLLPLGFEDGRRRLGATRIINVGGSAAYANYIVEVMEDASEIPKFRGQLTDYPRFAGSTWDLVARGIIVSMAGIEALPPRPVHSWRQDGS